MKIKSKNFEVLTDYPCFKMGTNTDADTLSRMCGIEDGEVVALCEILIEKDEKTFFITYSLKSTGEQRGIEFIEEKDKTRVGKNKDILELANNKQLKNENDILFMANQIKKGNVNYLNNCWYEAEIEVKNEEKEIIFSDYESNIGLEGVWESISSFKNMIDDDSSLIENISYIFEEIDNENTF